MNYTLQLISFFTVGMAYALFLEWHEKKPNALNDAMILILPFILMAICGAMLVQNWWQAIKIIGITAGAYFGIGFLAILYQFIRNYDQYRDMNQ